MSCLQPGTCVRPLCQLRLPSEPLASALSLSDPQFLSGVVKHGGELIPTLLTSLRSRGLLHVELPCPQQLISEGANVIRPLRHSFPSSQSGRLAGAGAQWQGDGDDSFPLSLRLSSFLILLWLRSSCSLMINVIPLPMFPKSLFPVLTSALTSRYLYPDDRGHLCLGIWWASQTPRFLQLTLFRGPSCLVSGPSGLPLTRAHCWSYHHSALPLVSYIEKSR